MATASTLPDAILAARRGEFSPLYTLDGGQNWHSFATKPSDDFRNVYHIAIAPKNDEEQPVRFLLAPNRSFNNFSSASSGIFRSADDGATWANYYPPPNPQCDDDPMNIVEEIVGSPADPLRHYLLVRCVRTIFSIEPTFRYYFTLFTSNDGGVSWQAMTLPYNQDPPSFFPYYSYSLQPSPAVPAQLFADAERYEQTKLWWRSDNSGQSWITATLSATALALDWTDASKLYRIEEHEGITAFRYTGKRSTNTGADWEDWPQQPCRTSFLQLITLPTADTLLMLCNQGLYRTNTRGDSWDLLTTETGGELSVHYGDRDLILWVRGAQLSSSRDQGATWQDLGGWQDAYMPNVRR